MDPFFASVIAATLISTTSFAGIIILILPAKTLSAILILFISLSSGALMGGAFFHLLPEAAKTLSQETVYMTMLVSFITFFLIEKYLHWQHCHEKDCHIHTFGYINLIGNAVHNFIDGLIIAGTFTVSIELGIITTVMIALHAVPQEIGDLGVFLYAGFSKKNAVFYNFIVSLMVVVGSIVGSFLSISMQGVIPFLPPFAAGGFLYIAASDLIPEMRKEEEGKKSFLSFLIFIAGIGLTLLIRLFG